LIHLIDASVFVFRAYFSIPADMTAPDGQPVNAVYGYGRFLLDYVEDLRRRAPDEELAVAFDESLTTSFRNEIYPAYKANRELPPPDLEAQFEHCRALTGHLGIDHFAHPRYEADDIIGTLTARRRAAGRSATIVSRDKDLAQLLRKGDRFFNPIDRKRFGYEDIAGRFGAIPEHFPDYQGLVGDKVDNIPGVPGIGPKTATVLVGALGALESIFAAPEAVAGLSLRGAAKLPERLAAHRDAAFLSRELATIATDMPLSAGDDLRPGPVDLDGLFALFDRLGFGDALRRQARRLAGEP
jgi:5'-3' exonuclease